MPRDPGLAYERTTLAWQRTALSSVGAGVLCLKVFWGGHVLGGALFLLVGALAYAVGNHPPVPPARLRAISLGWTAAAVVTLAVTIVG